ncbi:energy transducer TonB [Kordia zhangzhouensis]|uniref:energy transducer TonB n=1 Tax=Kordia zhangzhouensis TaxID=1620405 RepID=UPI00069B80A2|nr:energy transducer TonB [Kordia zhangzhouensis]
MKNVNHTKHVNANGVHESHLAKKNDLKVQKSSFLRFSVSLALSLFIVYTIFQVQTVKESEKAKVVTLIADNDLYVLEDFRVEQELVKELPPEEKVVSKVIYDQLKEIDDDAKETIKEVLKTEPETKKVTSFVNTDNVSVEDEIEEIEELPFAFVEDAPIFPGCEQYNSKKERKKCMSEKIQKHVNRKFDTSLAEELGLSEGKKRIDVLFIIDENGNVTGIQTRAPHPKLQKEAERVIRALPAMKPAKQSNKSVRVKYNLPIIFHVD